MKKLFKLTANWLIHHSEEYQSMTKAYVETIAVNESLKAENKEIKKLLGKAESQLIEIEKIINRYTNAKDIKKYIKEVL
jgi:uncharacterized lipoprotein YajG